ncbi:MAG: adenosine deaminase, partial [Propioniciclava sp.]
LHGETRWAPEQHQQGGLTLAEAVAAVGDGLRQGMAEAASLGTPIVARQLLTALRHQPPNAELAALAAAGEPHLVCGFDIAGPEDGFPASLHAATLGYLRDRWVPITIHAGEAAGTDSIAGALQQGALRLGHGARLVEDIAGEADEVRLGAVATWVRDRQIPLELSPSSNLQTGIAATMADHPFGRLADLGFAVTVNCDNRLMSRTTMSREMHLLSEAFGYDVDDLLGFTRNAARGAFLHLDERGDLLDRIAAASPR